jgi:hypothetical protein
MRREDSPSLRRLIQEDAVGQLRRRDGLMAALGSEEGSLKLDWVESVPRLLSEPALLEEVENEARQLWESGIRHIIWAGMGGSVLAVRVFTELGFCSGNDEQHFTLYPLDSTDPAALNDIVREIAASKNLALPAAGTAPGAEFLRAMLNDVMMIGVSMGKTSEEPITHLEWFADLLRQARLPASQHLLVMTLPGSYLENFARQHAVPTLPLQLDGGTGTGGRMSAPTTRVFLLPAALYLTRLSYTSNLIHLTGEADTGRLQRLISTDNLSDDQSDRKAGPLEMLLLQAWGEYNLDLATVRPADSPFVQLAAAMSDASVDGKCRMLLHMPEGWEAFVPWVEQLMEESLGKDGRGVVVFFDQALNSQAPGYHEDGLLHVYVETDIRDFGQEVHVFQLYEPLLASEEPRRRLVALTASFLEWQLSMALYGYLHRIQFAGQPAVENYKTRARALRSMDDPLEVIKNWNATTTSGKITLLAPQQMNIQGTPAFVYATFLRALLQTPGGQEELPGYLDFTCNGEMTADIAELIDFHMHTIGNMLRGVPVKLRRAPAAYHSTEQSEMDGPPQLISLRLLMRDHETSILGTYSDTFLRAQAVSTWQAMLESGRICLMMILEGSVDEAHEALEGFFQEVEGYLTTPIDNEN